IVIELKRDANAQLVLNQLFSYTQLQDTVGVIMLALDGGIPKVMNLREMLVAYLRHQEQVILRRTKYDLNKAREREHIVEGLKMVIDHTDEVIHIIRHSKDQPDAKQNLMDRFGITEAQSSAIVAMRLGQLSGMERIKIETELEDLRKTIADLEDILNNEHRLLEIVRNELNVIREKYGDDRRTDIQAVSGELDIEDLIPDESSVITLTHFGYVKRQASEVYKTQRRGGRGISGMTRREEDFVEDLFVCNSHDYVLFFTDKGRMYRIKAYEIPESSRASRGTNIVNILPMQPDEKITSVIKVSEVDEDSYLVMVTRQGTIKRTQLGAYRNVRKSGIIAITLDEGDELAWVRNTSGSDELLVATRNGMSIRFAEEDARAMGRTARGVRAITLAEGDQVVGMVRIHRDADVLTVAESGKGRRSSPDEYRLQSRGGKGVQNYNTEKNGLVAGVLTVNDRDDVIMITDDGVIIRIHAREVAVQSRYGSGVRAMRVAEGSKVVTLARVPYEEEEEEAEGETAEAEATEGETAEETTEE
ncbi:MAG: DNA gyrase subunit A, partial [Oscillospiraceae bacterium]|nr:DNA gyrase subunit A [Oscillospiraceae bacterium]